jgi:lysine biosynthesis protein LysW
MVCVCPECKNDVNLSRYPNVAISNVIECEKCGITLEVMSMEGGNMVTEIVDEGK